MTRDELISSAATEYVEKNQIAIRNMLPSINAMTAFVNGARWADKTMLDKACDWLQRSTILSETTIDRFRQAMEEQQ